MARFDRYLLAQLLSLFGLSALVLILVYWINSAVRLFEGLISDGQGLAVFLELTVLGLPLLITITLPIAACIAAIYVTNRMTADSELTVWQACGVSPWRMARPVLVFGLIVAGLMSVLTHHLVPAAAQRLDDRSDEIAANATGRLLRAGQFLSPADGITLFIREITDSGEMRQIFLSDSRSEATPVIYTAASAYLVRTERGPQLVLAEGQAQTLRADGESLGVTAFRDLAYDIGALMPRSSDDPRRPREVGTAELLRASPALQEETGESAGVLIVEGHRRFADPLLGAVAALLGFAALLTGGFSRFGAWRQILLAIGLVIAVKLIEGGTTSAVRSDPRLWPLLYLPVASGAAMVAGLLARAGRPLISRRVAA